MALKAGASLIINVNISGSPDPKVKWFHGEQELTKTNGINIETTQTGSTLTVKGVSSANAGTYKVVAENEAGSDIAEFTANIKGKNYDEPKIGYSLCTMVAWWVWD